jgi:hypothetical protein
MRTLEGVEVGYIESLHVVVETFTTTGYGEDANPWSTDGMYLLMMVMQFTGVALIFTTLPPFLIPLVGELESMDTDSVVVESDRGRARELITDVGPEFVVRTGDTLVVAGPDRDVNRFNELLG